MRVYLLLWLDVAMANKEVAGSEACLHHIECSPLSKMHMTTSLSRECVVELFSVEAESYAAGESMILEMLILSHGTNTWMYPWLPEHMQTAIVKRIPSVGDHLARERRRRE